MPPVIGDYWLFDCLKIAVPAILIAATALVGPTAYTVSKYGLKASVLLLSKLPARIAGYALLAFRQNFTIILATLTTFKGSLTGGLGVVTGKQSFFSVLEVFGTELYTKLLGVTSQFTKGLSQILAFFGKDNVCTQLTSLGKLAGGIVHIWYGLSSLIVLMFLYRLYRGRWQKAKVDKHEQLLVVALILMGSALLHVGVGQTQLGTLSDQLVSLADTLAQLVPNAGSTNTTELNQTLNASK
ncbi:MAG: hypothetical protein ABEJ56_05520 [Candidatus Nanohaloarchaea archaeon]